MNIFWVPAGSTGHTCALNKHRVQAAYFCINRCLLKFAAQRVIEFPARSQIALQNRVCRLVTSELEGEVDLLVVLDLQHTLHPSGSRIVRGQALAGGLRLLPDIHIHAAHLFRKIDKGRIVHTATSRSSLRILRSESSLGRLQRAELRIWKQSG